MLFRETVAAYSEKSYKTQKPYEEIRVKSKAVPLRATQALGGEEV
jgi:hypothetical protein